MRTPSGVRSAAPVLAALVVLLTIAACRTGGADEPGAGSGDEPLQAQVEITADSVFVTCGTAQVAIHRGAPIPNQPLFPNGSFDDIDGLQCDFDAFSWNSFIALNLGGEGGAPVWESWPESSDIFLPAGASIPVWNAGDPPPPHQIPDICPTEGGRMRVFQQLAKRPDALEESTEPFLSGPLIDANGWYSRFAIYVNQEMYSYIQSNDLYSRAGQATFTAAHTTNFPCGCNGSAHSDSTGACPRSGIGGAMMLKTAWKVLTPEDDSTRFHTMRALVYTPASDGQPATCNARTMGLVGFHIGHKTQESPQWVWSTFEQVDNVPTQNEPVDPSRRYSYYNRDCPDCQVNVPPPQPWNPHAEPVAANLRSQVMRVIPITAATLQMTQQVQPLLAGTVWTNYQLVSTQWPTNANGNNPNVTPASAGTNWCTPLNPVDNAGAPAPSFLGNTTLETYIQGRVPQASSSCINCHLNAATAVGTNSFSDFTYLLERAQ